MKFAKLQQRARRLGWRLRRINERSPLAARYAMRVGRHPEFRSSYLEFVALLIASAERSAS